VNFRLIKNDSVFDSKTKGQTPVEIQLAVTLYRFGHTGSGASYGNVAAKFGIGDGGSILDMTKRTIMVHFGYESTSFRIAVRFSFVKCLRLYLT
jgi:hypothetical protein